MVKKISIVLCLLALVNSGPLCAKNQHKPRHEVNRKSYALEESPWLTKKSAKAISPHLLPTDHPAKPALDSIFKASRATLDVQAFINAGFTIISTQPRSFVIVASHPLLPGYLVKVQYDDELRLKGETPFWKWMVRRCEGAKKIRNIIKKKKLQHFKVARKWIYPLPASPGVPDAPNYAPKPIILLVEDMNLESLDMSINAWRNQMTPEHLDELYTILLVVGGSSYRPDNVALTKDGHFAFIDTEYPFLITDMKKITQYLSPEMQTYWYSLFNL